MDRSRHDFRVVVYAAVEPSFVAFQPGSGCYSPQQKRRPSDVVQIRAPVNQKMDTINIPNPGKSSFQTFCTSLDHKNGQG